MERRTFLTALLAGPALLAVVQACNSSSGSGGTTPGTARKGLPAGVARSDKPRAASCVCDADAAVTVVNDFGVDLYNRLAATDAEPQPNLVFSPGSIAIALAMTRAGAKGKTATEMDTVLHVADPAGLAPSMNALTTGLGERTQTIAVPEGDAVDITLAIANSLWAQQGVAFETAFLDLLATQYGAGLQLVDYESNPEAARKLINAWVDDETKNRIPELLAPGTITPDTRLTLVNAIYMKAPWLAAFDEAATAPGEFTTNSGTVVKPAMMHVTSDLNYQAGAGWQAVELPYYGNLLSMLIVLPDAGGSLNDGVAALDSLRNIAASRKVNVSLPKFDIETAVELSKVLSALGMPSAFTDADFSGMTTEIELFIGAVIHQANITVDEKGTEAAAATAVVMKATAAPSQPEQPIDFVVDRPFVFAVRDNPTGAILFLGHIGDPTKTRG